MSLSATFTLLLNTSRDGSVLNGNAIACQRWVQISTLIPGVLLGGCFSARWGADHHWPLFRTTASVPGIGSIHPALLTGTWHQVNKKWNHWLCKESLWRLWPSTIKEHRFGTHYVLADIYIQIFQTDINPHEVWVVFKACNGLKSKWCHARKLLTKTANCTFFTSCHFIY